MCAPSAVGALTEGAMAGQMAADGVMAGEMAADISTNTHGAMAGEGTQQQAQ